MILVIIMCVLVQELYRFVRSKPMSVVAVMSPRAHPTNVTFKARRCREQAKINTFRDMSVI